MKENYISKILLLYIVAEINLFNYSIKHITSMKRKKRQANNKDRPQARNISLLNIRNFLHNRFFLYRILAAFQKYVIDGNSCNKSIFRIQPILLIRVQFLPNRIMHYIDYALYILCTYTIYTISYILYTIYYIHYIDYALYALYTISLYRLCTVYSMIRFRKVAEIQWWLLKVIVSQ